MITHETDKRVFCECNRCGKPFSFRKDFAYRLAPTLRDKGLCSACLSGKTPRKEH